MENVAAEVLDHRSSAAMAAWAHRPGDQVFDDVGIEGLVEHTNKIKEGSFVREAAVEHLGIHAIGDSMIPGADPMVISHERSRHGPVVAKLNNHSFNQFCSAIGARAGEYRKLPTAIAQIPLAWLTQNSLRKDVKMLVYKKPGEDSLECRAINSPSYGRIWNNELALAVKDHVDSTQWAVPKATAFHTKTGFITTNDRKTFIFLVNESNPIELPGSKAPMYRGFYAWNSEVGDGTCGIAEFLYNMACANRAIMNLTGFSELNIRHTSGAPDRWVRDAVPALNEYVNKGTSEVVALLESSKRKKVAKDEKGALNWLQERGFTKALAKSTLESAREEGRGADPDVSPYSVFNIIQGLTAEAKEKANNDERVDIESRAGRLMKAVM